MNILLCALFVPFLIGQNLSFSFYEYRSSQLSGPYGNRPPSRPYDNRPTGGSYQGASSGVPGGSYGGIPPYNPQYKPGDTYGNPSKNPYENQRPYEGPKQETDYSLPAKHHFQNRNIPSVLKNLFKLNSYLASVTNKLQKAKESLKTSKDEVINLQQLLDQLKQNLMDFGEAEVCDEGQVFSGKKCYKSVVRKKSFEGAKQQCLKDGGKLAIPDLGPQSTFGFDILKSDPGKAGDTMWLNGEKKLADIVMGNGFRLPKDPAHPYYRFQPEEDLDKDNTAVILKVPDSGAVDWFIGIEDSTIPHSFVCEFKPKLKFGAPPPSTPLRG